MVDREKRTWSATTSVASPAGTAPTSADGHARPRAGVPLAEADRPEKEFTGSGPAAEGGGRGEMAEA